MGLLAWAKIGAAVKMLASSYLLRECEEEGEEAAVTLCRAMLEGWLGPGSSTGISLGTTEH